MQKLAHFSNQWAVRPADPWVCVKTQKQWDQRAWLTHEPVTFFSWSLFSPSKKKTNEDADVTALPGYNC